MYKLGEDVQDSEHCSVESVKMVVLSTLVIKAAADPLIAPGRLLSYSVVHALRRYRRNMKFAYLFKGTETWFTKLINGVFDLMNGR